MTDSTPAVPARSVVERAREKGKGVLSRTVKQRRWVIAAAGSYLVWLGLVNTLDASEWLAGLFVAALAASLGYPHLAILDGLKLAPAFPWHVLRYLAVFLRALIEANIDVARRVISPSLPIRPGVVEARTELTSPLGKLLLANSITLTPGTLSVDVRGDKVLVHWIDITPGADMEHATQIIVGRFEKHLKRFLQ